MSGPLTRRPTASLFIQLLLLAALTVVASQAISLALIFIRPPPVPDIYRLGEIKRAFEGSGAPAWGERRPLEVVSLEGPPEPALTGKRGAAMDRRFAMELGVSPDDVVVAGDALPFLDRRVVRAVRKQIELENIPEEGYLVAPFQVGVRQAGGTWQVVRPKLGFGLETWQQHMLLMFLLSSVVIAPVAYVFARRLSAPIGDFAAAAERLGRDPGAPPMETRGSSEIAVAVRAFNDMQERLRRYVDDRTTMMGAIAHDLRTPLTRLRFRIENLGEEQRKKMAADIDEMEQMISATLTFVRDATQPGQRTPLELSSLVESLCDEMSETGAAAEVQQRDRVVLTGDPVALRRLFANLLENAVKFGGAARARITQDESSAVVEIDDDGPGIPPGDAERVFEPFYRREPSRSRKTGGIGLGLAVVRSIARAHGGDVSLMNRDGGGLTARVQLPR